MSSSFPGILAGVLSEGLGLNGLTWVFKQKIKERAGEAKRKEFNLFSSSYPSSLFISVFLCFFLISVFLAVTLYFFR